MGTVQGGRPSPLRGRRRRRWFAETFNIRHSVAGAKGRGPARGLATPGAHADPYGAGRPGGRTGGGGRFVARGRSPPVTCAHVAGEWAGAGSRAGRLPPERERVHAATHGGDPVHGRC